MSVRNGSDVQFILLAGYSIAGYMAQINAQRPGDAAKLLAWFNGFMRAARVGVTPEWTSSAFPPLKGVQGAFGQPRQQFRLTAAGQSNQGGKPLSITPLANQPESVVE